MAVQNDTEVFYAVPVDSRTGELDRTDARMGTREAIVRTGRQIDEASKSYCPHQWLDADGFVSQDLARLHPYSREREVSLRQVSGREMASDQGSATLAVGPTGFATLPTTPPGLNGPAAPLSVGLLDEKAIVQPPMAVPAQATNGEDGSPPLGQHGTLLLREEADTARIEGHTGPQRTVIIRAVLSNQLEAQLTAMSLLSAIDLKIELLRQSGSNFEVDEFSDLKRRVEEFLAANAKRDEAPIAEATLSIAAGLRRFWTEKHVSICGKTLDMSLICAGLGFCAVAGVLRVPTALAVGAIVGGKNVVEALAAAAKLLPESGPHPNQ
ncbi:hypothetical protein ACQR0V_27445 [Bradyrhizobium sp. HKCCYLS2058]|uniref:hypothetical protein n=1 Tax=unclassified Bradyrhizobium TaxID=2631580 RepID=UPI003EB9742B